MANVLIAGPIHEAGLALLECRSDVDYELLSPASASDIERRIAGLDAILLRLNPLSADVIGKAKRLKIVSRYGVGYDKIDVAALTRHGIPLTIVGDANAVPVAEQALGLMLAVARQTVVMDRATRSGDYAIRNHCTLTELQGKTVLVVGFGRVGRHTAKRCAAFDMTIVVADPFVAREEIEAAGYSYTGDFHDALGSADFVTLHLPGTLDGSPVMGAAEFGQMKQGAYLINVGRGTLVCEQALAGALSDGRLRGAGLDVTRDEPPARDCPLLELDNVILSPHVAGLTQECVARMSIVSVQNILDAIDGRINPQLVVNKEVLP